MKCYNHHDRDAFAVCTSCGKGLCLECIDQYHEQIVCKDSKTCKNRSKLLGSAYNVIRLNKYIGILMLLIAIPLLSISMRNLYLHQPGALAETIIWAIAVMLGARIFMVKR